MSRRKQQPSIACERCGTAITVVPNGRRYAKVDNVPTQILVPGQGIVTGWRLHTCVVPPTRKRRVKAQALPLGEDQGNRVSEV